MPTDPDPETTQALLRDVLERLPLAGRPPELAALPGPATHAAVREFEVRHSLELPPGLRALLAVHDGLPIERVTVLTVW